MSNSKLDLASIAKKAFRTSLVIELCFLAVVLLLIPFFVPLFEAGIRLAARFPDSVILGQTLPFLPIFLFSLVGTFVVIFPFMVMKALIVNEREVVIRYSGDFNRHREEKLGDTANIQVVTTGFGGLEREIPGTRFQRRALSGVDFGEDRLTNGPT